MMPTFLFPLLFGVGIAVAISGAAQLPEDGVTWPGSTPIFLFGVCLSLVGLGGWHRQRAIHVRNVRANTGAGNAEGSPFEAIQLIVPPVQTLAAEFDQMSELQVCERIDEVLDNYVTPVVEQRQTLIDHMGMGPAAEILCELAFAERMLNRAWSAASDGHLPEARSVYPDAVRSFEEAARLAQRFQRE